MDPMRLILYVAISAVVTLILLAGGGFYAGYTAGRIYSSSVGGSATARDTATQLREADLPAADLSALVEQIKALSTQVARLEAAPRGGAPGDNAARDELVTLRRSLSAAGEEASALRQQVAGLETRAREAETAASATRAAEPAQQPQAIAGAVVLSDTVLLKRDQNKNYDAVAVDLALHGVASRLARVSVNRKAFSVAFGERKMFREGSTVCELVLMETDMSADQARLALTCRR